jgi:D-tyrosyl-tRNA(Tyr) deacylase
VTVEGETVGEIDGPGLCCFVGVSQSDGPDQSRALAGKIWHLRVFPDRQGQMNASAAETAAQILVVSQFTLYADTSRGRRPSFVDAMPGPSAAPLVEEVIASLEGLGAAVRSGVFGAHMVVELANDGPVTIMLEVT